MNRIDELKAKFIKGDPEKEKMFEEQSKHLDTAVMIVELRKRMTFLSENLQRRPV